MRRWLEAAEIGTVGLPFCAFKAITGAHLIGLGLAPIGAPLLALGAVDLALNTINLVTTLAAGDRRVPTCALHAALGRDPRRTEIALALDMMLAFTLVAGMLGAGVLPSLPGPSLAAWNVAVILNVLGAGGMRLARAITTA